MALRSETSGADWADGRPPRRARVAGWVTFLGIAERVAMTSNLSGRPMRVEPFARSGVAIRTDLHFCSILRAIDNIPTLPSALSIRCFLRGNILKDRDQIPVPSRFEFGKSFPRFVPQFMNRHLLVSLREGSSIRVTAPSSLQWSSNPPVILAASLHPKTVAGFHTSNRNTELLFERESQPIDLSQELSSPQASGEPTAWPVVAAIDESLVRS